MRIGILGSGLMGGKLGTIFAKAGHDVVFSYARSQRKLNRLALEFPGFGGQTLASGSSRRSDAERTKSSGESARPMNSSRQIETGTA